MVKKVFKDDETEGGRLERATSIARRVKRYKLNKGRGVEDEEPEGGRLERATSIARRVKRYKLNKGRGVEHDNVIHTGGMIFHPIVYTPTAYMGHPLMGGIYGGDIWGDIGRALNPNTNGVAQAFSPGGSAQQFGEQIGQKLRDNVRPIITTGIDSGLSYATGVPMLGSLVGKAGLDDAVNRGLDKANLGFGIRGRKKQDDVMEGMGMKRPAKMVKGSAEAKAFMASLRAKRGKSKGGAIVDLPPRSRVPEGSM